MKPIHILLIIGGSLALASGCKKYDDGPHLSIHTKKARIANVWRFDKVVGSSGATITSLYDDMTIEFKKTGSTSKRSRIPRRPARGSSLMTKRRSRSPMITAVRPAN